MWFINYKKRNNRGFSLIELVLAISLFAVVVTPLMNSFITSYKINQKSRKLMAATDICQDIVEGYSEMTFETLNSYLNTMQTAEPTKMFRLTTVDNDKYNVSKNLVTFDDKTSIKVQKTEISVGGADYATVGIVSNNAAINALNKAMVDKVIASVGGGEAKPYFAWKTPETVKDASGAETLTEDGGLISMFYKDIDSGIGYKFNAVVIVYPIAETSVTFGAGTSNPTTINDIVHYCYGFKVCLYDAEVPLDSSFEVENYLVSMSGAIHAE